METKVSLFNKLPIAVSGRIIYHYLNDPVLVMLTKELIEFKRSKLAFSLLNVCRMLRAAIQRYIFMSYQITITGKQPLFAKYARWLDCKCKPDYIPFTLVKKLEFFIEYEAIFNGKALRELEEQYTDKPVFPNAYTLVMAVSEGKHYVQAPGDEENMRRLYRYIKKIAPNIQNVDTVNSVMNDELGGSEAKMLGTFATNICKHAKAPKLEIKEYCLPSSFAPTSDGILTQLSGYLDEFKHLLVSVVLRNSRSLKVLDFKFSNTEMSYLENIMFDEKGEIVVYHNLHRIKCTGALTGDGFVRAIHSSVVPFPVLRSVNFDMPYPFNDDVLFRGNGGSLESISVIMNQRCIDMLREYGVFSKNSNPKLASVAIWINNRTNELADANNVKWLLENLQSVQKLMVAHKGFTAPYKSLLLSRSLLLKNLVVAKLTRVRFMFEDILLLLVAAPKMTHISCAIERRGPIISDVDDKDVYKYVIDTYYPIKSALTCWNISDIYLSGDQLYLGKVSKCIILLSMLCPKFNCIDREGAFDSSIEKLIEEITFSPEIGEYISYVK